jgi:hypothetical protein
MSILERNPSNPNFLHPNKYTLTFARLPSVQFFCQGVSVPGISLGEVPRNNPFVDLYSPGEKAIYDQMNITFYVDEELTAWKEVHDWIRGMTKVTDFAEYRNLGASAKNKQASIRPDFPQFSDATLTLYSSSNTPLHRFKFYDCFPVSLSSFVVNSQDTPETIITADVGIRFAYFDIDKLF